MTYTITQVAAKMGLTTYTVRYYDKEGLLPFVDRTKSGTRIFKESDFEWLSLIICLKHSGMAIKDIKIFINWCLEGDSTLEKRLNMFNEHKKMVAEKMVELKKHMNKLDDKIQYYQIAVEAGTESIHGKCACIQSKIQQKFFQG